MAAPFGPHFALLAALFVALHGRVASCLGFNERVADRPGGDILEIERVAASGFQCFNQRYVPLGDFQEKLVS